MFGKLLKWEFRETVPLYGMLYLFVILTMLGAGWSGQMHSVTSADIMITIFMLIYLASVAVIFITPIWRYYHGIYGRRGYLTMTLPVLAKDIVLTKFLTAVFWLFASVLVIIATVLFLLKDSGIAIFSSKDLSILAMAAVHYLALFFFIISIGQMFHFKKGNIIIMVIAYFLLSKVSNFVSGQIGMLLLVWFDQLGHASFDFMLMLSAVIIFVPIYLGG